MDDRRKVVETVVVKACIALAEDDPQWLSVDLL